VDAIGAEQAESVIKGERPIITTCGSGMTAGVLWLGLKLLGVEKVGLYDEVSVSVVSITFTYLRNASVLDWICCPGVKCHREIAMTVLCWHTAIYFPFQRCIKNS
jgi:hypothetical protein